MKILRVETMDGIKFFLENPACAGLVSKGGAPAAETWLLLRASGTEPLLRLYSEAASPELVDEILTTAESFVKSGG
jgi:phosphomannomutase